MQDLKTCRILLVAFIVINYDNIKKKHASILWWMYTLAIRQPDLKTDFTFTEIIGRFLLNSILKLSLIEKHPVWILGWSSISVLKVQWNKRTRWLKRSTKFSLESYALLYQGQLRGKSRSFFQVTDVTVLHKWNPYRRLSAGANPEGQFGHVRRCANSKKKHERERDMWCLSILHPHYVGNVPVSVPHSSHLL